MTILTTLWTLATQNWWGRVISGAMVLLVAWKANNMIVGRKYVKEFVQASKTEGTKINAKNRKEREKAEATPGSADRLPCRDCK